MFWRLHDSLPEHHRVGNPVKQVGEWKALVLDAADPVRGWCNEFVEVGEFQATPLRPFAKACCEYLGWKSVDKAMPRVEAALKELDGVDVVGAVRRPRMVHGAALRGEASQAQL